MRVVNVIALILLIVGGLNWGLIALFEYDLVAQIGGVEFGETNAFTRTVYGLVGLSAIWVAIQAPEFLRERRGIHT